MSGIKKLASQTVWYGASTIFNRMLSYLLTPLLTSIFIASDFGKITTLFTIAAFMNIIYSFGMETAYFRFLTEENEDKVYNTAFSTIIINTILISIVFFFFAQPIAEFIKLPDHKEYIYWVILIVIFDTLAVLPFAKLRHSGRPRKYALIKMLNILLQISLVIFFFLICKPAAQGSFLSEFYNPQIGPGYVIVANVIASGITLLLLSRECLQFKWSADRMFWKKMIIYSLPLLIVGFGGMVNELIDRFMLLNIFPGSIEDRYTQSGIYAANYKLAVIIALFIQAFRLGAEPFFFKQSIKTDAPVIYARVMKFFVITCCICFLLVVLFLDFWKYFMGNKHPEYWKGLTVVPILMIAKIFLGIYYNLSVWYKLTNRNLTGAWITLSGVIITVLLNTLLVPRMGYTGCAIATLCCYFFMMIISYYLGQKYFPVPYDIKRISIYILIILLIFILHQWIIQFTDDLFVRMVLGILGCILFAVIILLSEKEEFRKFPVIRKWIN